MLIAYACDSRFGRADQAPILAEARNASFGRKGEDSPYQGWWRAFVMGEMAAAAFELGKVLLKVELSKFETKSILKSQGGAEAEGIVLQKIGKFWNQQNMWDRPDGLVVVTTHRLAFLAKEQAITATTEFLSFPFAVMAT